MDQIKRFTLFVASLLLLSFTVNSQVKDTKPAASTDAEKASVEVIRNIFKDFLQNDDGTDSRVHMEAMMRSLRSLPDIIDKAELPLLINVWMYYDPTGFNPREIIKPIFERNKQISLIGIRDRIKQKKEFESNDTAPYSDLVALEKELK
jgi:hypothetical protein